MILRCGNVLGKEKEWGKWEMSIRYQVLGIKFTGNEDEVLKW